MSAPSTLLTRSARPQVGSARTCFSASVRHGGAEVGAADADVDDGRWRCPVDPLTRPNGRGRRTRAIGRAPRARRAPRRGRRPRPTRTRPAQSQGGVQDGAILGDVDPRRREHRVASLRRRPMLDRPTPRARRAGRRRPGASSSRSAGRRRRPRSGSHGPGRRRTARRATGRTAWWPRHSVGDW